MEVKFTTHIEDTPQVLLETSNEALRETSDEKTLSPLLLGTGVTVSSTVSSPMDLNKLLAELQLQSGESRQQSALHLLEASSRLIFAYNEQQQHIFGKLTTVWKQNDKALDALARAEANVETISTKIEALDHTIETLETEKTKLQDEVMYAAESLDEVVRDQKAANQALVTARQSVEILQEQVALAGGAGADPQLDQQLAEASEILEAAQESALNADNAVAEKHQTLELVQDQLTLTETKIENCHIQQGVLNNDLAVAQRAVQRKQKKVDIFQRMVDTLLVRVNPNAFQSLLEAADVPTKTIQSILETIEEKKDEESEQLSSLSPSKLIREALDTQATLLQQMIDDSRTKTV